MPFSAAAPFASIGAADADDLLPLFPSARARGHFSRGLMTTPLMHPLPFARSRSPLGVFDDVCPTTVYACPILVRAIPAPAPGGTSAPSMPEVPSVPAVVLMRPRFSREYMTSCVYGRLNPLPPVSLFCHRTPRSLSVCPAGRLPQQSLWKL